MLSKKLRFFEEGREFRLRSWREKSSVNDLRMITNIQFKLSSRDVVFGFHNQTLVIYYFIENICKTYYKVLNGSKYLHKSIS